jgi:hypothetical protein
MRNIHPWALGLIIVISVFIIGTLALVVFVSKDPPDMVTDHYYEKDRAFQKRYEMLVRSSAMSVKPKILFNIPARVCIVQFPDSLSYAGINGSLRLYHVANSKSDFVRRLQLDGDGRQQISLRECAPGAWIAKLNFTLNTLEYYFEERFMIN